MLMLLLLVLIGQMESVVPRIVWLMHLVVHVVVISLRKLLVFLLASVGHTTVHLCAGTRRLLFFAVVLEIGVDVQVVDPFGQRHCVAAILIARSFTATHKHENNVFPKSCCYEICVCKTYRVSTVAVMTDLYIFYVTMEQINFFFVCK